MMTSLIKAAAGVVALAAATGAAASPLSTWVDTVGSRIDARAATLGPSATEAFAPDSGQIVVRFTRGADGRATNVEFVRGVRGLTRTAARMLAGVGALPPLPAGYDANTPIALNLMISTPSTFGRDTGARFRLAVAAATASAAKANATLEQAHESQLALAETPR